MCGYVHIMILLEDSQWTERRCQKMAMMTDPSPQKETPILKTKNDEKKKIFKKKKIFFFF